MYSPIDEVLFEGHWHCSKLQSVLFVIVVLLALYSIVSLSLPVYWQLLLVAVLLTYSIKIFVKNILWGQAASFSAIRKTSTNWFIYSKQQEWQLIRLRPDKCVVLPWVIVLAFFCGEKNRRFEVCLFKDSFAFDEFRQLVLYMRYS